MCTCLSLALSKYLCVSLLLVFFLITYGLFFVFFSLILFLCSSGPLPLIFVFFAYNIVIAISVLALSHQTMSSMRVKTTFISLCLHTVVPNTFLWSK